MGSKRLLLPTKTGGKKRFYRVGDAEERNQKQETSCDHCGGPRVEAFYRVSQRSHIVFGIAAVAKAKVKDFGFVEFFLKKREREKEKGGRGGTERGKRWVCEGAKGAGRVRMWRVQSRDFIQLDV
ncbi:unnamed protein product [Prunus armeniaca]|uniref:Uncharacterized protein n=1 Tax=Prunus armeniaca TaxID=36596 RepID=A0A6J5W5N4_PRUAR|nr:unnamed protein product [Prunus armeniaca]